MSKETKKTVKGDEAPVVNETTGAEAPVSTPVKEKVDIKKAFDTDIQMTKKILDAQEKVMFLVPLAEGEKAGAVHEVFINGYKTTITKGVMTKVPISVANMLANSYKISMEAGAESRIDGDAQKLDALS